MSSNGTWRQYLAAFLGSLTSMMIGIAYGWTSPTMVELEKPDSELPLTNFEVSWVVALIEVGNLVTPIPCGFLVDTWGRKSMLLLTAPMFLVSWILTIFTRSVHVLYAVRIFQGMAIGIVCTVCPTYLGEIADKEIRGSISTFFQAMMYLGILMQYCIGPYVSYTTLATCNAVVCVVFFVTFIWMPDSPYYLLMRGKEREAEKACMWFHAETSLYNIRDELTAIKENVEEDLSQKANWWDLVATSSSRKAFFILQVAATTKFLSGYLGVLSYAQHTFSAAEGAFLTPEKCAILLGFLLFLPMIGTGALSDRIGRRPLLLFSTIGCAFCEILAGAYYYVDANVSSVNLKPYNWIAFVTIASYFILFSAGLGPLVSTLRAELFPSNTRGIASGVTNITETIMCFVSLKMYYVVANVWGFAYNYWIFALFCIIGAIVIYFTVPETKGKSFAQIQKQFKQGNLGEELKPFRQTEKQ